MRRKLGLLWVLGISRIKATSRLLFQSYPWLSTVRIIYYFSQAVNGVRILPLSLHCFIPVQSVQRIIVDTDCGTVGTVFASCALPIL